MFDLSAPVSTVRFSLLSWKPSQKRECTRKHKGAHGNSALSRQKPHLEIIQIFLLAKAKCSSARRCKRLISNIKTVSLEIFCIFGSLILFLGGLSLNRIFCEPDRLLQRSQPSNCLCHRTALSSEQNPPIVIVFFNVFLFLIGRQGILLLIYYCPK